MRAGLTAVVVTTLVAGCSSSGSRPGPSPSSAEPASGVADALASIAPLPGGRGPGFTYQYEAPIVDGPSQSLLGSVEWNVQVTETAGTLSSHSANLFVYADGSAALKRARDTTVEQQLCSTQPKPVRGFDRSANARVCRNNGSPAGWQVSVDDATGVVELSIGSYSVSKSAAAAEARAIYKDLKPIANSVASAI